METLVISDRLREQLDECTVKAAVFTTYTFEPEFFELEVIPLLLSSSIPYSSDTRVKQFQVREKLRESPLSLEIFFDLKIYRQQGSTSPAMDYLFHGVHRGNSAFHPKVALILVEDHNHGSECLMVGAGSNNLTRAGWWDNIECMHWEVIWKDEAPKYFLEQVRSDVEWLQLERSLVDKASDSALDQIAEFLGNCKSWGKAEKIAYYEMNHLKDRHNFPNFIRKQARDNFVYSNWTLEIISPFFAEDPDNREHEFFFDLGVKEIHLLLPRDQEGTALCQPEYFERINDEDYIHWARWRNEMATGLGTKGQHFRRLHAKIYHFYNRKQSWMFVGSVNFSHKAMWDNNEAGFFTQLDKAGPLLEVIQRTSSVDAFEPPTELLPGFADEFEQDTTLPKISLAYDWSEQRLQGVCEKHYGYMINIFTPEGTEAISQFSITGTPRAWEGEVSALESLLRNGSWVKVGGVNSRSGEPFPTHKVMLQQTGWTHKPMDVPDLTPAQILAIYADLSPERREQVAYNEMIRKLIDLGEAGDLTGPTDELVVKQFFSEYAEIFHAFRRLQKRLNEAKEAENSKLVDYYLSGTGMDSLPTLLDQLETEDSVIDGVTQYLVLLCTQEIYRSPQALLSKHMKKQSSRVRKAIKAIKAGESIKLERGTAAERKTFFKWFEDQFYKQYRLKEAKE